MKSIFIILAAIFFLPQVEIRHRLVVNVSGLKPASGDLYLSLHERAEYFNIPDSALMKIMIPVKAEQETVIFDHVPTGRYALAIYHDENLNAIMDVNEKGIPVEGYGFSTKSRVMGKPKFEHAVFDVNKDDTLAIKMIYLTRP